jgi:hypothetical protein
VSFRSKRLTESHNPRVSVPTGTAYYAADVATLTAASLNEIVGSLTVNSGHAVEPDQRDAWLSQIQVLRTALAGLTGTLFLEFVVPRIGSRLDAVLISGPVIFVIEFKVGEATYRREDFNQAWDYALDLKNFHKGSHSAAILPILVATAASSSDTVLTVPHADGVYPPLRCNSAGLSHLLGLALTQLAGPSLDAVAWALSPYQPTPTIIEAAQALYSQHSVDAIARHDAGARNLRVTSQRVEQLIEQAKEQGRKLILFVTGVPGAGKTLVGLNVATKKRDLNQQEHATFLSGNGPLVAVLREALTRDELVRLRKKGDKTRRGEVGQKVQAFIQNVHHFRDAGLRDQGAPSDHVVIFDEAQRAWNLRKTADFMKRRKKRPGFTQSEPEFLLSYLDRHTDWAVVVCLVGGGQEINDGEAGISAWLDAVRDKFPEWHAYISPELTDTEYAAGKALVSLVENANVVPDRALHLSVSMRSFRAETVSHFVKAVLDCETSKASQLLAELSRKYPIALTRDLGLAKRWIRHQARGTERYGLVASSGAQRLKPHAIDVRVDINPTHWFLNDPGDTRSSWFLEDAATEFQVQGLELDWVCMTWDADFRFAQSDWSYNSFRGHKWTRVRHADRQSYLRNAYRVLLTRARQGMVIFVPAGEGRDATRSPEFYDSTFSYLASLGIPVLQT